MTAATLLARFSGAPWPILPDALETIAEVATRVDALNPAALEGWKRHMAEPCRLEAVAAMRGAILPASPSWACKGRSSATQTL